MKALELKLCLKLAQDSSVDLSGVDSGVLYGFGCSDFVPVAVSVKVVAACMRWQCCCFDGSWDWKQYNEDRPYYLKNVELAELTGPEGRAWLANEVRTILEGVTA